MDELKEEENSKKNLTKNSSKKSKNTKIKKTKKKSAISSSSSSFYPFVNLKLTKAQKRYKKYKKSIKLIPNINTKIACVYLNELTKINNQNLNEEYIKEKILIEQKKFNNMLKFYNKIREIVNSTDIKEINKFIFENDFKSYNIELDTPNKAKSNKSIIVVENNNNNIINQNINKKNDNKVAPIKNFWKLSLINCQFFKINKIDAQIFNYLRDIIIVPLDYPNYRIEFHFKKNEHMKQTILTKEYFYKNPEKEILISSRGCEIDWEEDNMNPTLKHLKKVVQEIKVHKKTKIQKTKEEDIYVYNESFFKMFDIDKSTIEKDFIEGNFFINDFVPNILEYYLNIIEIRYDDFEDELISNN